MALNNPAARLHNVLTLCKKNRKEMGGQPMTKAWRKVLSLSEETEDIIVMSKVGFIYLLPSQIASEIQRFEDLDHRLYLGWQNDLAQAFTQISFGAAFSGFVDRLSDSLLINIEFCSHELSKRCPEKMVDEAELQKLKEAAYALYQEILKANPPPDLSRYLLDHLYLIVEAIDNYMLSGARGLRTVVDAIVGTALTNHQTARQAKESTFGERFWGIAGKVAVLLDLAKTAMELGDGTFKMLPGK
jgi:hypothetical protein